jgi:hypothetical protein
LGRLVIDLDLWFGNFRLFPAEHRPTPAGPVRWRLVAFGGAITGAMILNEINNTNQPKWKNDQE